MKMLVFGSLNIDHTYRMPHLVRAGETLASASYQRNAGGKGLNQTIALARAGQPVSMAGAIGEDGLFLKAYLDSFGVDTSLIRICEEATGHAIIQLDAEGQNAIMLYGGANQQMTKESVSDALSGFGPGDYLLLQNEINCLDEIVRLAKEKGMKVILNPSPMSDSLPALLPQVDWLILNEVEGADLTGTSDPDAIVDALLARYPACRIVLTLGTQGSMYADGENRYFQPVIKVEAVDTTAAGDTFTGFFFQSVLSGRDIPYALRLAANASAIAVTRPGAGGSIPSLDEVLEKMK
ncbi:MAG: ribokinase [Clostridia bacterium]|nr:ribokinase [Clostridia bacterium]